MPLTRFTIKSALRFARQRVTVAQAADGTWSVHSQYPDGSQAPTEHGLTPKQARAKQREMRIFISLLILGVESTYALPAALDATAAADRASADGRRIRPWREVVADYFERFSLAGKA